MCFPKTPKIEPVKQPDPVIIKPEVPDPAPPPAQAPLAPASAPGAAPSPRQAANARKRLRIDLSPVAPAGAPGAGLRIPT